MAGIKPFMTSQWFHWAKSEAINWPISLCRNSHKAELFFEIRKTREYNRLFYFRISLSGDCGPEFTFIPKHDIVRSQHMGEDSTDMGKRQKIERSLELKLLINEQGDYKEETQDFLDFVEARIFNQMNIFDKKVRKSIQTVLDSLDFEELSEQDIFKIAEEEFRKEFENWADEAANGMERGIRHILLDWRQR